MATISGIGDEALQVDAELGGDLGDHLGQGMAVIRVARQCGDMGDKLTALAALDRRCHRDFDAEFIGLVGFAFAVSDASFPTVLDEIMAPRAFGQGLA